MDKKVSSGTNESGTDWEVYKDHSIGDHYLIIDGGMRPVFTGTKAQCEEMAEGWT